MSEQLTAWSYSRYQTYQTCPKKAFFLYIRKLKEPPSEVLERGSRIHKDMEDYLSYSDWPMPDSAGAFQALLAELKGHKAIAEAAWGFKKDWTPCPFFDKNAWLRAKIDAHYCYMKGKIPTCKVIDFKTGKVRPKNIEQLELYAIAAFIMYPEVEIVETELWYLDEADGAPQSETFFRGELPKLIKKWEARVAGYFSDTTFLPKVSALCGWCSFAKAKGGPCPVGATKSI